MSTTGSGSKHDDGEVLGDEVYYVYFSDLLTNACTFVFKYTK